MSAEGSEFSLGPGLPSCIERDSEGVRLLNETLGLNGHRRKALLSSKFVKTCTEAARGRLKGAQNRLQPGERDRLLLLEFYRQPEHRRAVLSSAWHEEVRHGGDNSQAPLLIPSLEQCILTRYVPDLLRLQRVSPSDMPYRTVADEAWTRTQEELKRWQSLDEDERRGVVLVTFAVATILDDRRILETATEAISELKDEFGSMLGGYPNKKITDATLTDSDPLNEWETCCISLLASIERAMGPPPSVDPLESIAEQVAKLRELAPAVQSVLSLSDLDELISRVARTLADLRSDTEFSWIDEALGVQIHARWLSARESFSDTKIAQENQRLDLVVDAALEQFRKTFEELSGAQAHLNKLQSEMPTGLASRHEWEEALDEHENRVQILRRKQREAQYNLLAVLSPFGDTFNPRTNYAGLEAVQADSPNASAAAEQMEIPNETSASQTQGAPADGSNLANINESVPKSGPPPSFALDESRPPPLDDSDHTEPVSDTISGSLPTIPETDNSAGYPENEKIAVHSDQPVLESRVQPLAYPDILSVPTVPLEFDPPEAEDSLLARTSSEIIDALSVSPPRTTYAFQLSRLATRAGLVDNETLTVLLEAAALSDHLQLPNGSLASALVHAFQRFPPRQNFSRDPWRDRYVLLGLAGVLRPSLLTPQSGALSILNGLEPSNRLAAVYAFIKTIAEQSKPLQGARIDPAVLRSAGSQVHWEEERDRLIADTRAWQVQAPHKTIKFAPATMVWQKWLKPDGPIYDLLEQFASRNSDLDRIEMLASRLAEPKQFRDQVDHTDRREIRRRKGKRIESKALEQLYAYAQEAVDLAQRFLSLNNSQPSDLDFLTDALVKTREQVGRLAPPSLEELRAFEAETTCWTVGIANVAAHAIERFRDFIEARCPTDDTEPDPIQILASGLFGFPWLCVDSQGEPEGDPKSILDDLLNSGPPVDFTDAFDKRLADSDLGTARRIVDWLELSEPDENAVLRERLDNTISSQAGALRRGVDEVRSKVESAFVRGAISDDVQRECQAALTDCEHRIAQSLVVRFDREKEKLLQIANTIENKVGEQRDQARRDLNNLAIPTKSLEYQAIERSIEDGDMVTVRELIQRHQDKAPQERAKPAAISQRAFEAFEDFYPKRSRIIEETIESSGFQRIIGELTRGRRLVNMPLGPVPGAQRQSAASMLSAWFELKRSNPSTVDIKALETLFTGLGFIVQNLKFKRTDRDSAVATLTTVPLAGRELCPVPAYGSFARGRYQVVLLWGRPSEEDVLQHANTRAGADPTFILYFGRLTEKRREGLGSLARRQSRTLLVLDELLLVFLCGERGSRLPIFFACALPFSYVQPYVTIAGVVPPEMFFGREREIEDLTSPSGPVFIFGGRQLGKTALLRAVERHFHRPADGCFAIWLDLKGFGIGYDRETEEIWLLLWRALRDIAAIPEDFREPKLGTRRKSVEEFIDRLCTHFDVSSGNRLLLLLDEADRFLEVDAHTPEGTTADQGYRDSVRLKALMDRTERQIKVVFAGLHNVLRTARSANHPLGHFGQPLQIGPFSLNGEWRTAEQLVTQPLRAAGYQFGDQSLVTYILAQTNYYPSLLQHYGSALIKEMCSRCPAGAPLYNIDQRILEETYKSTNLREIIRSRFHLTLQLDPRYEVIAYALANRCIEDPDSLARGIERRRIEDLAREWWPEGFDNIDPYTDGFWSLLDEMVGLGVLVSVSDTDDRYTLRSANVLLLMGTDEEISDTLLRDREPPQEFSREVFRARKPGATDDAPERSPLTFHQEDLLRAERNHVSLVCGLPAAGFDDVIPFLAARVGEASVVNLDGLTDQQSFEAKLKDQAKSRPEGVTTYVVSSSVPWGEKWIEVGREQVKRLQARDRYMHIVFLADPACLWQLLPNLGELRRTGFNWISLEPWRKHFLRQWMTDVGLGDDPNARKEIADLTGGWWKLIEGPYADANGSGHFRSGDINWYLERLKMQADRANASDWPTFFALDRLDVRTTLQCLAENEEELPFIYEYAQTDGIDRTTVRRILDWAEILHLVRRTGYGQNLPVWKMDPVAARVLLHSNS